MDDGFKYSHANQTTPNTKQQGRGKGQQRQADEEVEEDEKEALLLLLDRRKLNPRRCNVRCQVVS
jgi:hypothetical protein